MSIFYEDDLLLSGDQYLDYAVVVKCSNSSKTLQTAFTLRIHNPCIDPEHVRVASEVELPDTASYILDQPEIPIDSESLLSIRTTPIDTDLCQDNISYFITWDGTEVTEVSSPVKIVSQSTFTLNLALASDDLA